MNKDNEIEVAIEIFKKNSNLLRLSDAVKKGIPEYLIYKMLAAGSIIREERGLYSLVDAEPLNYPDMVKVSVLVPKSVICLISALYYYDLTTQIPNTVYIALPQNIRTPRIQYPPVEIVKLSHKVYLAGIVELILDGVKVRIYSPEKTITDCFKFRKKVGEDVALEALKDYMREPHPKIDKLVEFARINRVEKLMRPYLETLA